MSFINDIIKGIQNIVRVFHQLICFFATVPVRIRNMNAGFNNVFTGVAKEVEAVGISFVDATSSLGLLGAYVGEFISTYTECGAKYVSNFFSCIFYYLVDVILSIFYLTIRILLWLIKTLSNDVIDLYWLEEHVANKIEVFNQFQYMFSEVNINKWPKHIREKCYLCVRLKTEAVKNTASDVNTVFTEKIPNNFKGPGKYFDIGSKQFAEIFGMPVLTPESHEY